MIEISYGGHPQIIVNPLPNKNTEWPERTGRDGRMYIAILCFAVLGLTGCSEPDYVALFDRAETHCMKQEWDEASVLLKKILLANPDHAGAHYYLGHCYLNAEDFRPHIAEGEFQTAVHIFMQTDRKSPIERFDDEYFEFICHISSAKVVLSTIQDLAEVGVPLRRLRGLLRQARQYSDTAAAVIPYAPEVQNLNALIDAMEAIASGSPWHPQTPSTELRGPISI